MKYLKQQKHVLLICLLGGIGLFVVAPGTTDSVAEAYNPQAPQVGEPLRGLSPQLAALFSAGRDAFTHEYTATEGLGPLYNERACQTCHGGLGGAVGGPDPIGVGSSFNVVHFGLDQDGLFNGLRPFGGPVRQVRTIQDNGVPGCPMAAETVPPFANVISVRHTPAIWGFGLLDAIPDATILARQNLGRHGVIGFANWGREPQARERTATPAFPELQVWGPSRVGRFGWKSQTATLEQFSAEPFNIELGVSSILFPQERTPSGLVMGAAGLPPGCDVAASDPNDVDQADSYALYHFQALTAPPPPLQATSESNRGRALFNAMGCTDCHVRQMRTGAEYWMETADGTTVRVRELERQQVRAYTDLLLHDMGPALADNGGANIGRTMGRARGQHWRTTPLWGLRFKRAYLHDGRTGDLEEAVLLHGGEGQWSRDQFDGLSRADRDRVLAFMRRL